MVSFVLSPLRIVTLCCVLVCLTSIVFLYALYRPLHSSTLQLTDTDALLKETADHVYPSSRTNITLKEKINGMHVLSKVKGLSRLEPTYIPRDDITTTVYMLYSDISSPLYDLFTLHKRATKYCDVDTTAEGCDIRLPRSYTYDELSLKMLDSLDIMCRAPHKTDYYVKIDDDLIMSESMLDKIIRKMATTDCQVTGSIALDYAFYWPEGQMYIFTRNILETACKNMPYITDVYPNEDITFGLLLNSTDPGMFCSNGWPRNHWHKHYSDRRVEINYK
ncbi:hypothetical protein GGI11_006504 [Coemansia sp. RSA 2049]|nr:hypothetical protein GGI11_006504 [Coemansia sp. RSA 2049]KAJ2691662.1 hypothetical protein GGH99_002249 [Coemansia sp. RSA 1285]